jgi:hypothetical protein
MAEVTVHIPDEQLARLHAYLAQQGGNLADFVSEAVDDRLAWEDDPMIQSEVDARIRKSISELDRGEGIDARQAMRELADGFGIKLNR